MKKIIAILLCASLTTGCASMRVNGVEPQTNSDTKQLMMAVGTIVVLGAVAGSLGKQNQKSKCQNNRAGFWQDHTTGKIYTCP